MTTFADLSRPLALLRLLAVDHPELPAPTVHVASFSPDTVEFSFHEGLSAFEAWRDALNIDPATVRHHLQGDDTTICLQVSGEIADASIKLVGYGQNLAPLRAVA